MNFKKIFFLCLKVEKSITTQIVDYEGKVYYKD